MPPPVRTLFAVVACVFALATAAPATAAGESSVAALQVGLAQRQLYRGTIDGVMGAATLAALKAFQHNAGVVVDGIAGPGTRAAFGQYGRWTLGSRSLRIGARGWDVAQLQFLLAWHGFPTSRFTGLFGSHTLAALRRFQAWAGLPVDAIAGPATVAALRQPPPRAPLALGLPLALPIADAFGPRDDRFHAGIDIPATAGTTIVSAGPGRIVHAGWLAGGWGYAVMIDHGLGVRSLYAHLSSVTVTSGRRIVRGRRIGRVGASGAARGPHLHFELRVRDAAVDPQQAFALAGR